jgi:hypothetical protein
LFSDTHDRIRKKLLAELVLNVLVYDVKGGYGLMVINPATGRTQRFNPYRPLLSQMTLHTFALIYAVAKWYWKRDNGKHSKRGR